ncbi:MAG: OmpW family outer membrane protein [Pseudomonadota bacterium]
MNTHKRTCTQTLCRSYTLIAAGLILMAPVAHAAADGWSVVPYIGLSVLDNQAPQIESEGIASGQAEVSVDSGFTSGLSVRYDYRDSRWTSEFGWEYRSNDSRITGAADTQLPAGNYASNTFFLNGRFALSNDQKWTPWIGGGVSWVQEIDLDSETATTERSFSDSGAVGFQLMAGADYDLSDRIYFTSELRYTSFTGMDLTQEGGDGSVTDIDYQPLTLAVGIGFRF